MYVTIDWLRDNGYISTETEDSEVEPYILLAQKLIESFTGRIFEKRNIQYFWESGNKDFIVNNPVFNVTGLSSYYSYNIKNDYTRDSFKIILSTKLLEPVTVIVEEGFLEDDTVPLLIKTAMGLLIKLKEENQLSNSLLEVGIKKHKLDRYEYEFKDHSEIPIIGDGIINAIIKTFMRKSRLGRGEVELYIGLV